MFDWLFEGRPTVYVTLGVLALLLAAAWYRDQRRKWLFAIGGVALVAGVYLLLDFAVETRREQIARRLSLIQAAVKSGNAAQVMEQFSPRFQYRGVSREEFRDRVTARLKDHFVEDLTIWEVRVLDDSSKVFFMAKPKGPRVGDNVGFRVEADFGKDADGQWRMVGFEVFNPFVDTNSPLDILPYVP